MRQIDTIEIKLRWLLAACEAVNAGNLFYWIDGRHPSRAVES